ncbi:MAG TPA: peptide deformylase [Candidatus Fermentibacter daniensis]|nr:peptide deformylase [Candidatus Fermentibacter daniensis]OQC69238.1 MAG: Peptide deformylase [candidate division Hyd24-12 bacterium ADurb.Bin004]HOZ17088.1 peptide deformylase [Candidatus Fermentibacter daniensis]HPH39921.1 peptide deformylase [Candidatus Fermentibacter daniensis]HPN62832.1 peptide deformylase [Candidatus Fermentibacter daniensis]
MRSIRIYGSPELGVVSREVALPGDSGLLESLLPDMERLLMDEEGLGLAAPQAGENVRVFLMETSLLPSLQGHRVFVNPVLQTGGPPSRHEEGCLSLPGIWEPVVRPSLVSISACDEHGKPFALELDGMAARVAQHENDHLDGILFIDRLGQLRRRLLRSKLQKLAGG